MMRRLVVFVFALLATSAQAGTRIGGANGVEISVGGGSDQLPEAVLRMDERLSDLFGLDAYTDLELGFSSVEYLKMNVRLMLSQNDPSEDPRATRWRVFLVMPFLGDLRVKPGYNDPRADGWGENLSMDASYGGFGIQLAREVTDQVKVSGRAFLAHRATAEMLPEGKFTTEGARIMNRRDENGSLVTNVIDARGAKLDLRIQAEVLKKLLVGLHAMASKLSQNGTPYSDYETEVNAEYQVAKRGRARFNVYGDYYWRRTDLTDLGQDRSFHRVSAGANVRW